MKLEPENWNTYGKTLLYTVYMIYFHIKYCILKLAVQVYISPPQFSSVNRNRKQISGYLRRTETQENSQYYSESSAGAATAIQDKH
jgi:hypothetical protein